MIKRHIDNELWIELDNSSLWNSISGLSIVLRGGGNATNPKLHKSGRLRVDDVVIRQNKNGIDYIFPNPTKGISFSTTIDRIASTPIRGIVWKLPKNTLLPEGLVFNLKSKENDHPLLNASREMPLAEFIDKLNFLASKMIKTNHKVLKKGGTR